MPGHNSAAHSSAHRPPPPWPLPIQRETQQSPQLRVLRLEQRAEQRREQLSVQLLEQLLEHLTTQLRVQPAIQVEIQLAIQVKTHVLVQASIQLRTLLPVLPGELLRILLGTQARLRREVPVTSYQFPGRRKELSPRPRGSPATVVGLCGRSRIELGTPQRGPEGRKA